MKRLFLITLLMAGMAGAVTVQYPGLALDSLILGDTNWSNKDSFACTRGYADRVIGAYGWTDTSLTTGWGLILTWDSLVGTMVVDSNTVETWLHGFTDWTDTQARDTASRALSLAVWDSINGGAAADSDFVRVTADSGRFGLATISGTAYPADSGNNGEVLTTNGAGVASWAAAPAGGDSTWLYGTFTDSVNSAKFIGPLTGDVSGSSGSCTGNAATADSSKGGAARATLAANATNAYNADSLGNKPAVAYQTIVVDTLAEASGNVAVDLANGHIKFLTMTTDDTLLNPTNLINGSTVKLILMQDGDGSSLMTWSSHFRFCGDTATVGYATAAPTLTATALAGDIFEFLCLNDSMLYFQNFLPAVLP